MPKTRKNTRCPLFGDSQKLNNNLLPTYCDIIKHYLWIRNDLIALHNGKDPSIKEVSEIVSNDVESIWNKASLPTISHQQVVARLISYYNKYKSTKKLRSETKKQEFYQDSLQKLFDIATCKCISRGLCKCETKIPIGEEPFLKDQRNARKMYIGSVDQVATKSLHRKDLRKRKYQEFLKTTADTPTSSTSTTDAVVEYLSDSTSTETEVKEFCPLKPCKQKKETLQMRKKLKNLATACDRTGVSDRSAAIIVNAAMLDLNVISSENSSKVIDRSKLRRERQKVRVGLQCEAAGLRKPISSLYFDGRKDKTLFIAKTDNILHRKTVTEEHISLISEPDSEYIGHLSIDSGKAVTIERSIVDFLETNFELRTSLVAIGCDGTAVNTGHKNGVIALLEKHFGRPLQWFVCLLHANELPLRHLFASLDGTTTGPNSFSGSIGKMLEKCLSFKVVNFEAVNAALPDVDADSLSTDQKYLHQMCLAISRGSILPALASKDPGKLAHSRWLTCANRILRLYVGTENPSDNLKELVIFIVKVYAPTWFDIKTKPSCKNGPLHIFNMLKRSLYLRDDLKNIVIRTIQRNSFFVHPENLLLAMLQDDQSHIRELALRRLIKARQLRNGNEVREFQLPKLQIDASNYYELIDWSKEKVTEPPMTMKYSDTEISNMISSKDNLMFLQKLPCHTQAVERCVKLVTEASLSVCGQEARDGYIRAKIKSRQELPFFETKSQYFNRTGGPTTSAGSN